MKKCQKVRKSAKNYETILPFSCCPLVFPLNNEQEESRLLNLGCVMFTYIMRCAKVDTEHDRAKVPPYNGCRSSKGQHD